MEEDLNVLRALCIGAVFAVVLSLLFEYSNKREFDKMESNKNLEIRTLKDSLLECEKKRTKDQEETIQLLTEVHQYLNKEKNDRN